MGTCSYVVIMARASSVIDIDRLRNSATCDRHIRLDDAIYSHSARHDHTDHYAIDHPEVRAVVLAFDSPGGTVVDTESVYMELARPDHEACCHGCQRHTRGAYYLP